MSDSFYRAFEDRHRGSRELIKSRLGVYAPFLKPLAVVMQPATAIDLGCGRGEWLEILGEHAFDAFGVDLDDGMLEGCRERNLKARKADAIQSLQELPDNSMALVSAFHVVEHMPFATARILIAEALRVLKPGGLLVLETPNPENLMVGSASFYQDPSHERPVPAELLRFAVEHAGFHRTKVLGLQESRDLHAAAPIRLFDVLSGVSPDYAVVAQKSATENVLAELDAPFSAHYGLTLATLAQRYDDQANKRSAEAIELVHQAEVRVAGNAQAMAERIARLEQTLPQAIERLAQAESQIARALAAEEQLHAILLSRSWRITAPLRSAGDTLRRLRVAAREGRLANVAKNRLKPIIRRAGYEVMRRPHLKRYALAALDHMPGLKDRLRNFLHASTAAGPHGGQKPDSLSPRAARIYSELKKAIDARKK